MSRYQFYESPNAEVFDIRSNTIIGGSVEPGGTDGEEEIS